MIVKRITGQLQPGDILSAAGHRPRRVVTLVIPSRADVILYVVSIEPCVPSASPQPPFAPLAPEQYTALESVDVEVPDLVLTPEELAWLVTCGHLVVDGGMAHPDRLPALLDRLDPPKPPTMDEVLQALLVLADGVELVAGGDWLGAEANARNTARDLVNRARRCGMLPPVRIDG